MELQPMAIRQQTHYNCSTRVIEGETHDGTNPSANPRGGIFRAARELNLLALSILLAPDFLLDLLPNNSSTAIPEFWLRLKTSCKIIFLLQFSNFGCKLFKIRQHNITILPHFSQFSL